MPYNIENDVFLANRGYIIYNTLHYGPMFLRFIWMQLNFTNPWIAVFVLQETAAGQQMQNR